MTCLLATRLTAQRAYRYLTPTFCWQSQADQGSVDDLAGQLAALKARGTSGAAAAPAAAQSSAASSATPTVDSAALDGLIRSVALT